MIGVRHKNCWGSLCTLKYPEIVMKEKGPINVEKISGGVKLSACWDVSFKNKKEFQSFLKHLKTQMLPNLQNGRVSERLCRNLFLNWSDHHVLKPR